MHRGDNFIPLTHGKDEIQNAANLEISTQNQYNSQFSYTLVDTTQQMVVNQARSCYQRMNCG